MTGDRHDVMPTGSQELDLRPALIAAQRLIGTPGPEAAITFTLVRARHCVQARQGAHAKFRADVCSCLHRLPGRNFPSVALH